MKFSDRINQLSNQQLDEVNKIAELTSSSYTSVYRWVKGEQEPTMVKKRIIADFYNVSVESLFPETDIYTPETAEEERMPYTFMFLKYVFGDKLAEGLDYLTDMYNGKTELPTLCITGDKGSGKTMLANYINKTIPKGWARYTWGSHLTEKNKATIAEANPYLIIIDDIRPYNMPEAFRWIKGRNVIICSQAGEEVKKITANDPDKYLITETSYYRKFRNFPKDVEIYEEAPMFQQYLASRKRGSVPTIK